MIGLGAMGMGVARSLLRGGFDVHACGVWLGLQGDASFKDIVRAFVDDELGGNIPQH